MNRPSTGVLRVLRSSVVTVVVVGLAVLAHVVGGGQVPRGLAAAAVVVLVASAVHLVTRWRLGLPALLALLTAGQFLLHHAFAALDIAHATPLGAVTPGAGAAGHSAHAVPGASLHSTLTAGAEHAGNGHWALTPVLVHVAATALTALVLASGERALWRLCAWLVPLVRALVLRARPVVARLPRAPLGVPDRRALRDVLLARSLSRRGPPALSHA